MNRMIRSIVELRYEEDVELHELPDDWNDLTEDQQDAHLAEIPVTHQNNVAPCSAKVVDVTDDTTATS